MTYYRFRVAGRKARDISTVFNSALSRRGGKSRRKSRSFSHVGDTNPNRSSGINHRHNLLAPRYIRRTQIPSDLQTRQIYFRPPAGKMARLHRGDRHRSIVPPPPPLSLATTSLERRSETITPLPARKSLKVSDYFRESLVFR